jgi:hypothetical protein
VEVKKLLCILSPRVIAFSGVLNEARAVTYAVHALRSGDDMPPLTTKAMHREEGEKLKGPADALARKMDLELNGTLTVFMSPPSPRRRIHSDTHNFNTHKFTEN